jgi:hypothetical protein
MKNNFRLYHYRPLKEKEKIQRTGRDKKCFLKFLNSLGVNYKIRSPQEHLFFIADRLPNPFECGTLETHGRASLPRPSLPLPLFASRNEPERLSGITNYDK